MSCIAVLITQHIISDLKAAAQLCSMITCRNSLLTKVTGPWYVRRYCCIVKVATPFTQLRSFTIYSLDLNRLLNQLPLTADIGGRYCSSSAVLSHDMSPRTWLRSVMPQSLMAVSSSSRKTVSSSVDIHSRFINTTYYQHNAPLLLCRT